MRIKEEFKKSGNFWLPSNPEIKVPGILSIADGGNVELETIGWLNVSNRVLNGEDDEKRIVGQLEDDLSVIIDDCFCYNAPAPSFSIDSNNNDEFKSFFSINGKTFIGITCDEDENILLNNLTFSVEGIEEWVGINSQSEEILFNLSNEMKLSILFDDKPPSENNITEAKINPKAYFKLVSLEKRDVKDFIFIAEKITTLLCFAIDQIVCLKDISATIIDENPASRPISVDIYYRSRPYSQKKTIITRRRMLFRYQDIQNKCEQVVNAWIEANRLSSTVFRSYFLAKTGISLEDNFLKLARGLEEFHRSLLLGDRRMYLRNRLVEMIDPFKNFIGFNEERSEIITSVVKTRNYLAHDAQSLQDEAASGQDLVYLYLKMEALFQLNLLSKLGFTPEEIQSIFDANDQLNYKLKEAPKKILNYITPDGKIPFEEWLNSLRDINERTKIKARLRRVELGNLGDYKTVGGGVCELRINYGKGYRIYFGQVVSVIIILLSGGDKDTQQNDIQKAKQYWLNYQSNQNNGNH